MRWGTLKLGYPPLNLVGGPPIYSEMGYAKTRVPSTKFSGVHYVSPRPCKGYALGLLDKVVDPRLIIREVEAETRSRDLSNLQVFAIYYRLLDCYKA